jgi:hypothetical protein
MKVSGFTFIRNAIKYDFPVVESIRSILPICDEFIIAVGNSEDETLDLIKNINDPKIKIIETTWDDSLRDGGRVLAVETDKAFDAIADDSDWAFYIQGDEVFHEKDLSEIYTAMKTYTDEARVEGFVFHYVNFYGSYDYIADSHKWLKDEIRVIRNDKSIRSWKDAMSFRRNGKVLRCKALDIDVFHYGWVKDPRTQMQKRKDFERLWHDDTYVESKIAVADEFDYQNIDTLKKYKGTHPAVMQERINRVNWTFSFDPVKSMKVSPRIKFPISKFRVENRTI